MSREEVQRQAQVARTAAMQNKASLLTAPNPYSRPPAPIVSPAPVEPSWRAGAPSITTTFKPSNPYGSPRDTSASSPLLGSPATPPSAALMQEKDSVQPLTVPEQKAAKMRSGGGLMSEFTPAPYDRPDSLTPSMSASNVDSNVSAPGAHETANYEHYQAGKSKLLSSKDKYEFDAMYWLNEDAKDEHDPLHDPGPRGARKEVERRITEPEGSGGLFTSRGIVNLGALLIIALALIAVFAGWPMADYFSRPRQSKLGAFNSGGINSTGQVGVIPTFRGLIDRDTPQEALTKIGSDGKTEYQLVFSDEFETEGRTFWPGDDPFWTAQDIYYYGTHDEEWYDPDQITTKDGNLIITFDQADPATNHNLSYKSGMLQSWNQFCFQGGILEASIKLPGSPQVAGFWPGFWSMGNLGRPGFGATNEGTWPYSYNECDLGTLRNQSDAKKGLPTWLVKNETGTGDDTNLNAFSYAPGQRLSRCTCAGEDHPGPQNADGSYKGRSAPEIDVLEAIVTESVGAGQVSQSLQLGPYSYKYELQNATTEAVDIFSTDGNTIINAFKGNVFQQTASALTILPLDAYELSPKPRYATYAYEYEPSDTGNGYITWISDNQKTWHVSDKAYGPDPLALIGQRLTPNEPMSIIVNLGMAISFSKIDLAKLQFPGRMHVDYVRLYQRKGQGMKIGCDPPEYPTHDYIQSHLNAYSNQNLSTWAEAGYTFPKNSMVDNCKAPSKRSKRHVTPRQH